MSSDPTSQTTSLVLASISLTLSIIVFFWQVIINHRKTNYDKSALHLDAAIKAYEDGIQMLSDGNNDRITWNTAARVLSRAEAISTYITDKKHCDILEAKKEGYRRQLYGILGYRNIQITGAFFYGVTNPETPIQMAAEESNKTENYNGVEWTQRTDIDESALCCICKIAQFPDNYQDHLKGKFDDSEINKGINRRNFPGLIEYLEHLRKNISGQ